MSAPDCKHMCRDSGWICGDCHAALRVSLEVAIETAHARGSEIKRLRAAMVHSAVQLDPGTTVRQGLVGALGEDPAQ